MKFAKYLAVIASMLIILIISGENLTANAANLSTIQKQALAAWTITDAAGVKYNAYFFSANAKRTITSPNAIWAGANTGDIIYEGDFSLALCNAKTGKLAATPPTLKDFTYNATRKMAYVIKSGIAGQPDLIAIAQTESSSIESAKLFYVAGGNLKNIRTKSFNQFSDSIYYVRETHPKIIKSGTYQTVDYCNAENVGFSFNTFAFDKASGILTNTSTTSFFNKNYDAGNAIFLKWKANPTYFFEAPTTPEKD